MDSMKSSHDKTVAEFQMKIDNILLALGNTKDSDEKYAKTSTENAGRKSVVLSMWNTGTLCT